jgi:heme-degrading monooxygenase HmoA
VEPIARTPAPPYYAVVFTSRRTADDEGYADMAREMEELAARQPGFLGTESVRAPEGVGITVSYWTSADAVRAWKTHAEHRVAQRLGREKWYAAYRIRVCRVERDYGFEA